MSLATRIPWDPLSSLQIWNTRLGLLVKPRLITIIITIMIIMMMIIIVILVIIVVKVILIKFSMEIGRVPGLLSTGSTASS